MNRFIFTGPTGVGKTFLVKYCAMLLAKMGKRVAVVDMTKRRGIYFSLLIDEMSNDVYALSDMVDAGENNAFSYGDIDFFTEAPSQVIDFCLFNLNFSKNQNAKKIYDVVLIEADLEYLHEVALSEGTQIFLVQDFNRYNMSHSIKSLLRLSRHSNPGVSKITMIYNKGVNCKFSRFKTDESIMFATHGGNVDRLLLDLGKDEIVIPFSVKDYKVDLDNISEGTIEIRKLSFRTRKYIKKICDIIYQLSDHEGKNHHDKVKNINEYKNANGRGGSLGHAI